MKKTCAIFTIVKNEKFNLNIWISHYKKFFNVEDIYVLDHQSTDDSTKYLDVNVVEVKNDLAFDHQWLVDTVQKFQGELLSKYECVIFAEADELIYSALKPLNETIVDFISSEHDYLTCSGYDVVQNVETEKALNIGDDVFKYRNYWYPNIMYDKTLITKVPLYWAWGFHTTNRPANKSMNIYMAHLHRVDLEQMYERHKERATKWNLKNDGHAGFHHRIGDRQGVEKFFHDIPKHLIEQIPLEHKSQLYFINES